MSVLTTLKIIFVGDSDVGKSSIILRFVENKFNNDLKPTVGVDFKLAIMAVDKFKVKLALWDTAGQERFRTLTPAYYRGAHAVVFVYDVTNEESFRNLQEWNLEAERYSTKSGMVKMVIGNKTDRDPADRVVSRARAIRFAQQHRMLYLELSAKTSEGVRIAFEDLAKEIIKNPSLWVPCKNTVAIRKHDDETSCQHC